MRNGVMSAKELKAYNSMTPEQQDEWVKDGNPDAVLLVDRELTEFYRPTLHGVAVGPRCETFKQARALAAAMLAEMLAPDLPPKQVLVDALCPSETVVPA